MLQRCNLLTASVLTIAATTFAGDIDSIDPTPRELQSPIQRSFERSLWHSYAAATVESNFTQFQAIADESNAARDAVLVKGIPLGADLDVDAMLRETTSIHEGSRFVVMQEQPDGSVAEVEIDAPNLVVLTGQVVGDDRSRILLAEGDMGTMGYVRLEDRTFIFSSGHQGKEQPTLSFDVNLLPKGALELLPLSCELLEISDQENQQDQSSGGSMGGLASGVLPCRKVGFAIETDNEYLSNLFGGNQNSANAYTATLLAGTSDIYVEQFNTYLEIDYLRLWATNDPWDSSGTSSQLTAFVQYWQDNMTSVDRDLAHFLSGRGLGGGVAYLGGLCGGGSAYALSANLNGFFPYPIVDNSNQNWDLMVFAHETGHSFGSPHTHDYSPAIDGCASGDCSVADANEATIMSYCHLCSGGLSNMRMEFHPRVEELILNYLDNVSCSYTGAGEGAVAVDDTYELNVTTTTTILNVLTNDAPVSCGAISISSLGSTSSAGGTLELLPGSGSSLDRVRYTAPEDFVGTDSFNYTISDNIGNEATATVTIEIATNVTFSIVGGTPESIFPENQRLEVIAVGSGVTVDTGTFLARIQDGSGWQTVAFDYLGNSRFGGNLPTVACPRSAEIQFSVDSTSGVNYVSDSVFTTVGFPLDDFEEANPLWNVSGEIVDGDSGIWERGTPDGDNDRGDPATDFDGSGICWLTGAASGNTDVDDGSTILTSVRFAADEDTIVTWAQWYDNTFGNAPNADVFTIEITNDFGDTWTLVDQAGPSNNNNSGGWILQEIRVADYITPTTGMKMRWTASDLGDGSVVEAAIDAYGTGECIAGEETIPGDLNGNGTVDGEDLAILLGSWGSNGPGDIDGNGTTNGSDLTILLGNWT